MPAYVIAANPDMPSWCEHIGYWCIGRNGLDDNFSEPQKLSKLHHRQVSNLRRSEYQKLNVSRLSLQLSLRNILKPGVKPIMKMYLEQRRQTML